MSASLFEDVGCDEDLAACLLLSRGPQPLRRMPRHVVPSWAEYLSM